MEIALARYSPVGSKPFVQPNDDSQPTRYVPPRIADFDSAPDADMAVTPATPTTTARQARISHLARFTDMPSFPLRKRVRSSSLQFVRVLAVQVGFQQADYA